MVFSVASSHDRDGCAMSTSLPAPPIYTQPAPIKMLIFNPYIANATQSPSPAKYFNGSVQFHRRRIPLNSTKISHMADRRAGKVRQRIAKFLSLFTVVQFANDLCRARRGDTGSPIDGTCFHHLQCRSLGGVVGGECAQGYGVCCVFESSCGETTRQNGSYFVKPDLIGGGNPLTPNSAGLTCQLTVEKAHPSVSQLRLDFQQFELAPPKDGECLEEAFLVTGNEPGYAVPPICGFNSGQHMYVQLAQHDAPVQLTLRLRQPTSKIRVKVTQLSATDALAAPPGCLQFYSGGTGAIQSFNYAGPKPGYTNSLNYAICIRKEPGHCSVTYRAEGPFQLINYDKDGMLNNPPGQAGAGFLFCPDDYIVLNGLRLCGNRFNDASLDPDNTHNAPVTDKSLGPFIMPVRTNTLHTGTGFSLTYSQNPCPAG